jgi:hypothetical protein
VNNNIYFDLNKLFANPEKRAKTGHGFLMIPYEYFYAIIGAHLGACEQSVFLYILRETYGKKNMWKVQKLSRYKHHPVNYISTKDIMRYTGYSQPRVTVALNRLEKDHGMIAIIEEARKGSGWKIEFQPDIGKWNIGEAGKLGALEYHRNPNPKGKEANEAKEQTEPIEVEKDEDEEKLLAELEGM